MTGGGAPGCYMTGTTTYYTMQQTTSQMSFMGTGLLEVRRL